MGKHPQFPPSAWPGDPKQPPQPQSPPLAQPRDPNRSTSAPKGPKSPLSASPGDPKHSSHPPGDPDLPHQPDQGTPNTLLSTKGAKSFPQAGQGTPNNSLEPKSPPSAQPTDTSPIPSAPKDPNLLPQPNRGSPNTPSTPKPNLLPSAQAGDPKHPPQPPRNEIFSLSPSRGPQPPPISPPSSRRGAPGASPSPTRQAAEEERVRVPQVAVLQQHQGAGSPLSRRQHRQEPPQPQRGCRHRAAGAEPSQQRPVSQSEPGAAPTPSNHRQTAPRRWPISCGDPRAATVAPLRDGGENGGGNAGSVPSGRRRVVSKTPRNGGVRLVYCSELGGTGRDRTVTAKSPSVPPYDAEARAFWCKNSEIWRLPASPQGWRLLERLLLFLRLVVALGRARACRRNGRGAAGPPLGARSSPGGAAGGEGGAVGKPAKRGEKCLLGVGSEPGWATTSWLVTALVW